MWTMLWVLSYFLLSSLAIVFCGLLRSGISAGKATVAFVLLLGHVSGAVTELSEVCQ